VALPIAHIIVPEPTEDAPLRTLYQRITDPPNNWAKPLWDVVNRHEPLATLRNAIQQGQPVIIVSDATVSTTGYGACAWNLWSNQILWSGAGRVPGSSHDMYSGLAEAFGVYMSIQFVLRYFSQYPIIYHRNARITVYCDNQGVIDRIDHSAATPYPRDMIANDYPIYQEIRTTITHLHPIKLLFRHVDRHLDTKKPKRPLTIAETLNIDCDTRATQHFQA